MRLELLLFFRYIGYGVMLGLAYDLIRMVRRRVIAGRIRVAVEDMLYWLTVAIFLFWRLFVDNNGILRGNLAIGLALGAFFIHIFLPRIVLFTTKQLKNDGKERKIHKREIRK